MPIMKSYGQTMTHIIQFFLEKNVLLFVWDWLFEVRTGPGDYVSYINFKQILKHFIGTLISIFNPYLKFITSYPVLINQNQNLEMKIRFLIKRNRNLCSNCNSGS